MPRRGVMGQRRARAEEEEEERGVSEGRRERGRGRETWLENRIQSDPTTQHYLKWKENTLRLAREKLVESES